MEANSKPEFWTQERCYIVEILNEESRPEFSLARCRVEPGVTTQLHRLDVMEWYVMKDGEGLMFVGDETPRRVGPGDTVMIPAGTPQQISNTGSADLVFVCVCTPRFKPDGYESLEQGA